ncbi:DUF2059 domain-containing protein [Planktotalea sp.]|uniref:DUF2059 domain-containing protein n=1 Tax=Planktotalea sp. TaxID=2029877 RepID=UPI0025E3EB2D|nr:DUF2059 domain-containing protein [Planktotalea sp.]
MDRFHIALASLLLVILPSVFSASEATDRLLTTLGMERMVTLMQQEGRAYGVELGDEMLPGGNSDSWAALVARIYDTDAMQTSVRRGFGAALEGVDLTPLEQFFATPEGRTIVNLELSAREAMMDSAIEEAAKEQARAYEMARDDAFVLVDEFVKAGDLLEANVVGALNSNIQFYRGLVDGGAFELTEDEILTDVWAQEDETRSETRDWLYGFLIMAYAPLELGQLETYTLLTETKEGAALTAALFEGFDSMYSDISYALGLAAARAMKAEEI